MKNLWPAGLVATFFVSVSMADRYGIEEAMQEGSGSGSGAAVTAFLGWIVFGAAIGVVVGLIKNSSREEKLALDGCAIYGAIAGFAGMVLSMVIL